jgi:hypothetical protein
MSPLATDLEKVLSQVDPQTATLLEQTIRDALALAQRRTPATGPADDMGYPIGYFGSTAGSFSGEPLEAPRELPPQSREPW